MRCREEVSGFHLHLVLLPNSEKSLPRKSHVDTPESLIDQLGSELRGQGQGWGSVRLSQVKINLFFSGLVAGLVDASCCRCPASRRAFTAARFLAASAFLAFSRSSRLMRVVPASVRVVPAPSVLKIDEMRLRPAREKV